MRYFTVELKENYATLGNDGKNPTMVCFLPHNIKEMGRENAKRPCILVCPGGGYGFCSQREAEVIALKFVNMGFNAFLLYYSVAPHRYPSALCEVAAAYDTICNNADEWNCDTEKMGIIGFSAGGHLSAHYSNAYNSDAVKTLFPNAKRPDFCVLCYPVITADPTFAHQDSFRQLLGYYPEGAEQDKFSCEKLVTPDTPPTFIWHTREDQAVPVKNSLAYATALTENNVPYTLHIYPYGEHGLSTCDKLTLNENDITSKKVLAQGWLDELKKWLDTII